MSTDLALIDAPSRLTDSLFSKDLAPHYMELAKKLAASEIVPKCFRNKPADLFIAWAMGYQIGIPPEQAMQCIAVVNGKAAMWGDDMLALCMAHKDFEDIIEEPIVKDDSVFGYTCTVKRKGMTTKVNKFTLDDAKKAGLLAKGGVWVQYTERMLKLRARGFSLRDAFPDALKGIKPREEVEDYIDAEYKVVDDAGLSQTQRLKNDYIAKTGKAPIQETPQPDIASENSLDTQAPIEDEGHLPVDGDGARASELHSEIRLLISEKGVTDEQLAKSFKFYEVDGIDELDLDSCKHFINHLIKV